MEDYKTLIVWGTVLSTIAISLFYWWFLCLIVSNAGGWSRLAEKYPAETKPSRKELVRWQSMRIGRCSYLRSVSLCTSAQGLYMRVGWFFRPAHAPLFIPWSAVLHREARELGTGPVIELLVDAVPVGVELRFPLPLAAKLKLEEFELHHGATEDTEEE